MSPFFSTLLLLGLAQAAEGDSPEGEGPPPTHTAPATPAAEGPEPPKVVPTSPPYSPAWERPVANASPAAIDSWLDAVVLLMTGPAWCSGVVIDELGTIATAYHCVASGLRTHVETRSGKTGEGRVIAVAPREDLALVRVESLAGQVPALKLRASPVAVGERVYGLGHPFAPAAERSRAMEGMLLWSVSEGIVSAVGPRLIQTDAALNPGNSGGPVVDVAGNILGITSRKLQADNIAFLAHVDELRTLQANPKRPGFFGGHLESRLGLTQPLSLSAAGSTEIALAVVFRETLFVEGGWGFSTGARSLSLEQGTGTSRTASLNAGLRRRFGYGRVSPHLDLLGGLSVFNRWNASWDADQETWTVLPGPADLSPTVGARLGVSGVALAVDYRLEQQPIDALILSVQLEWPGVFLTF